MARYAFTSKQQLGSAPVTQQLLTPICRYSASRLSRILHAAACSELSVVRVQLLIARIGHRAHPLAFSRFGFAAVMAKTMSGTNRKALMAFTRNGLNPEEFAL